MRFKPVDQRDFARHEVEKEEDEQAEGFAEMLAPVRAEVGPCEIPEAIHRLLSWAKAISHAL
jgi:hypothetical protein